MNLTSSDAVAYLDVLRPLVEDVLDRELFVLPAFPVLWVARDRLSGSRIAWGAQDVHAADGGAHTGDVAAPMLADLGCRFVAVGHAERRRDHGESADGIAAKVEAILRWGMSPIICVGDSRPQAPSDALKEMLADLERCLARVAVPLLARVVVAYEPTWAIGAGATAAPAAAVGAVHDGIRSFLEARGPGGGAARVIYGGSVDELSAPDLLAIPSVDGLFVGRRALDPRAFAAIARLPIRRA